MNDDTLYTLEEAEKIFLRRLAKLAEKRSVQFHEAISSAGMGMMLSDRVWDEELADTLVYYHSYRVRLRPRCHAARIVLFSDFSYHNYIGFWIYTLTSLK